jgi:hypothetical protein
MNALHSLRVDPIWVSGAKHLNGHLFILKPSDLHQPGGLYI